ncbi:NAD(P)-dependent dehydrogenase, short-chain alcohol dehydrogenase family [Paraburkholderia fungorum]|uniref:NAD(P)-dependent dehydrogenase, short-chain alcohol dehydrogenase family n=1 Tax=Paraburkholderia fungorum TaxID=134537 RepID=A0A1H1JKV6_9BURK|nr:SDR family oxidoreductase [Paraburkholderia fungorum]SDR50047.1 NAD(P)-dependent dehydrogenase, short-chain alcohol dehydrogenase family [Paraburkholderia fungorum]
MNWQSQKVVVMGGSSGLGLATVARLSAAGADVVAVGRDRDKLDKALAGLEGTGNVVGEALDCTDRAALDRFFGRVGRVDHLVLTLSGGEGAGLFRELDLAALRRGFEAKVWPQLEAAQAALPALRRDGSLTFVTAISARIANPGTAGLGAINGALESMIGTLARELAPMRVNAVSPGVIDTAWWDRFPASVKTDLFRQQAETLPVGRVGHADDIAHALQFLMENTFMTGAVVECDGGLRLL